MMDEFSRSRGFQWEQGNAEKNWIAHRVTQAECEQVLLEAPLLLVQDVQHSERERRFYGLGRTEADRRLFIVFTIRGELVRVISARDMSLRERRAYERARDQTDT